ncbi:MAG TPA: class I SAM-dependent methyltransferase [Coxiellaceae bacterium]|nr:MAG: hypothetical protein A3E81_03880 [Gammaproteobacteria bacterium RIFCSPHIGHO2_12_FULL_36_30]HLB56106.1 class I SAM-dependent methyltransferase [Coxiellaceae bacterium]
MRTANDYYKKIMLSLDQDQTNLDSPLVIFLKKQSFSLMRGMQISNLDKIGSIQILISAATAIAKQHDKNVFNLLSSIQIDIATTADDLHPVRDERIKNAGKYIESFLYGGQNKADLKKLYNGKPWLLSDKHAPSQRSSKGLQKPESNIPGSGLIPTKNQMGWEVPPVDSDVFTQEFQLRVSDETKKRVLILGAGYGSFAYSLLESTRHNSTKVVVNDLSEEQMAIFTDLLPREFDGRVTVISGDFLSAANFPPNHFDEILVQNVIHFFTPEQMEIFLSRAYFWLKPNGSLTITCSTPYWGVFAGENNHIKIFENKKSAGEEWPGFIDNLKKYFEERNHPAAKIAFDGPLHNQDGDTLSRAAKQYGFQLAKKGLFAMPTTFPTMFQLDGREYAGLTATKPVCP